MIDAKTLAKLISESEDLEAVAAKLNEGWEYSLQEYIDGKWENKYSHSDHELVENFLNTHISWPKGARYRIVIRKVLSKMKATVSLESD